MRPALTSERLEEIVARNAGNDIAAADVTALAREIERLADRLSDAWLLLDEIARNKRWSASDDLAERAAELLRRQQAPGWKGGAA